MRAADEEDGAPLSRILPRALMVPPGIPEFMTRERTVAAGACELEGRAWSGHAEIAGVEVRVDGGEWKPATIGAELGPWAWRGWRFTWDAKPGVHVLECRARDA